MVILCHLKGIKMQLSILTCALLCSQLKAASFCIMGNPGLSIHVNVVEQPLQKEVSLFLLGVE